MAIGPWQDTSRRSALTTQLEERLAADERVAHVVRFGSLAGDPDIPDEFSDIDLDVTLRPGTSDLQFAKNVRAIVGEISPVRAGRTIWLNGFGYVEAVWFEGLAPYWHVDVRCRSEAHEPDAGYGLKDDWADGYTHWMLAVKRLARAFRFLGQHRAAITNGSDELLLPAPVVTDLRDLLARHHSAASRIQGSAQFHELCLEVEAAVLVPAGR